MKIKKSGESDNLPLYGDKLFFKTKDRIKLCGVLTKPEGKTDKCIVLCHGITVDKDSHGVFIEIANRLSCLGFAVFRFDFRGHGESEGDSVNLTVRGEKKDLEAAIELLKGFGYHNFGILASSFGGGPVSLYCKEHTDILKALVFWNAAIDYERILQLELPFIERHFINEAMHKLETEGYIEIGHQKFRLGKKLYNEIRRIKPWKHLLGIETPILFVHGDKDVYVPYSDSVKYSAMLKNALLKTVHGAHHGFTDNRSIEEEADQAAVSFFLAHL